MTAPDERAFRADAAKPNFRLGQLEGRWRLVEVTWPQAWIGVTAKDGPSPTGTPWEASAGSPPR